MDINQQNQTTNFRLYELDRNYKEGSNLVAYIDEAQNFYNGNQYPTNNFKNDIRVTLNICSFATQIKASKICGTPIYLAFTADDNSVDCNALRRFDEYNCNKLHLKTSNYQSALNGLTNGTEVTFIRWDDDDTTYKGIYKGGLIEEHIDLRNFAVANPYIQDIQNQQWVMFWDDVPVGALKELVEGENEKEIEAKKALLEREGNKGDKDDYKDKDLINHALCRLFTRFFRVDGEVYFMCSTRNVDIFAFPHPLSRKVSKTVIEKVVKEYKKMMEKSLEDEEGNIIEDYKIDYEDLIMCSVKSHAFTDSEYKNIKEKFSLYPFAVWRPFLQNRSFYGRSGVKELIPIQKAINFGTSMMLKCGENNAYNKIFAKPEALRGQEVTNEPGQVLIDYSGFTNGWGVKFAESQPMPNGLLDFTDRLLTTARVVYGFNDVMDGSVTNQDMSGYMLSQMIKQSNTSIEQQQQLFWVYNEEKAAIRLMYYKHYVDRAKYSYQLTDSEYEKEEAARKNLQFKLAKGQKLAAFPEAKAEDFAKPTHKTQTRDIRNEDIYGINFDISIDAMQGLADSKLVEQQMWDNLLLNGGINNISPDILEMYICASPNVSERTKTELRHVVENLKQGKIKQLEGQLQDLMQKTQQIMEYAKKLEAMNGYQGTYLKNLETEFKNKINTQNQVIGGLTKDLDKYRGYSNEVTEGEVKSNNSRGIEGTSSQ